MRHLRLALVEQFVPTSIHALTLRDAVLSHLAEEQRWSESYQAEALLQQLGFAPAQWAIPVADLSGGQQNLLLLARAMVHKPQLLILDEPTNHLDLQGKEQLEAELIASAATLLMTSHDRAFLDRLATRWLWIHQGRLLELTSPRPFYESLLRLPRVTKPEARVPTVVAEPAPTVSAVDQDTILARLDLLEGLLKADLARRPRFQKPLAQQQWRAEIEHLWRQLEES